MTQSLAHEDDFPAARSAKQRKASARGRSLLWHLGAPPGFLRRPLCYRRSCGWGTLLVSWSCRPTASVPSFSIRPFLECFRRVEGKCHSVLAAFISWSPSRLRGCLLSYSIPEEARSLGNLCFISRPWGYLFLLIPFDQKGKFMNGYNEWILPSVSWRVCNWNNISEVRRPSSHQRLLEWSVRTHWTLAFRVCAPSLWHCLTVVRVYLSANQQGSLGWHDSIVLIIMGSLGWLSPLSTYSWT